MADLKTSYLGLELKNPLVVGACNICKDFANVKKLEEAGAAAVVYKSLFEEQIQLESLELEEDLSEYDDRNAEMTRIFPEMEHAGAKEHLLKLEKLKKTVNIPVIASLNALYEDSWVQYAKDLESTGADALELNFYSVPKDGSLSGSQIEEERIGYLSEIISAVKIPVSVKMTPFYSNVLNMVTEMDKVGAKGFVLFNRLFEPDIDIDSLTHTSPFNISTHADNRMSMRYIGMLYGKIKAELIANSGIFTAEDVIKMILAGAGSVQLVSTLYKNRLSYVSTIITELNNWMDDRGFATIDEFKGKLSMDKIVDPFYYKRAQYVDILMNSNEINKAYPIR
jgi:dihydroorotate dehydrogenase (fumarate)